MHAYCYNWQTHWFKDEETQKTKRTSRDLLYHWRVHLIREIIHSNTFVWMKGETFKHFLKNVIGNTLISLRTLLGLHATKHLVVIFVLKPQKKEPMPLQFFLSFSGHHNSIIAKRLLHMQNRKRWQGYGRIGFPKRLLWNTVTFHHIHAKCTRSATVFYPMQWHVIWIVTLVARRRRHVFRVQTLAKASDRRRTNRR